MDRRRPAVASQAAMRSPTRPRRRRTLRSGSAWCSARCSSWRRPCPTVARTTTRAPRATCAGRAPTAGCSRAPVATATATTRRGPGTATYARVVARAEGRRRRPTGVRHLALGPPAAGAGRCGRGADARERDAARAVQAHPRRVAPVSAERRTLAAGLRRTYAGRSARRRQRRRLTGTERLGGRLWAPVGVSAATRRALTGQLETELQGGCDATHPPGVTAATGSRTRKAPPDAGLSSMPEEGLEPPTRGL